MRMSIAEPIQTLEYLRDSGVFPFSTKEGVLYTIESIDVAIDTMRKYQTMQEVLEKVWNVPSCMLDEAECLCKIMETYRTVR